MLLHDDVIKWKHFPRYRLFVRGIHQSPGNSPRKRQWRGALMFSLICAWINAWVNNREGGDLRRHRAYYDVTVMLIFKMHMVRTCWDCTVCLWHYMIWFAAGRHREMPSEKVYIVICLLISSLNDGMELSESGDHDILASDHVLTIIVIKW